MLGALRVGTPDGPAALDAERVGLLDEPLVLDAERVVLRAELLVLDAQRVGGEQRLGPGRVCSPEPKDARRGLDGLPAADSVPDVVLQSRAPVLAPRAEVVAGQCGSRELELPPFPGAHSAARARVLRFELRPPEDARPALYT